MRSSAALIGPWLLVASVAVSAANSDFYVGASLGRAHQDAQPGRAPAIAGGGVISATQLSSFTVDPHVSTWQATLGYRISPHWAGELNYVHVGAARASARYTGALFLPIPFSVTTVTTAHDTDSEMDGPSVTGLGRVPLGRRWELFLRTGLIFVDRRLTQAPIAGFNERVDATETWQAGLGMDWAVSGRWKVRLEYQRYGKLKANEVLGEGKVWQASLGIVSRAVPGALHPDASVDSRLYIGASFGRAHQEAAPGTAPSLLVASGLFAFQFVPMQLNGFDVASHQDAWNATVGYRVGRHWAAEIGYDHTGDASIKAAYGAQSSIPAPPLPINSTVDLASEVHGPSLTGLGILPVGRSLELFVRAGLFFADRRVTQFHANGQTQQSDGTETWLAGVGAD